MSNRTVMILNDLVQKPCENTLLNFNARVSGLETRQIALLLVAMSFRTDSAQRRRDDLDEQVATRMAYSDYCRSVPYRPHEGVRS